MSSQGTTHIIGAGLAGLSAATTLAGLGHRVAVYEASGQAGGRCRSYQDKLFGGIIDNGNHLVLSGNDVTRAYLRQIGAKEPFLPSKKPVFDFVDARTAERWQLRLSKGRIPFWLFNKTRRIPGTQARDYFPLLRLLSATPQDTVNRLLAPGTAVYRRLWQPVLLSALNTGLEEASARLAGAVLRGTLLKGGRACMPLVAERLASVYIDPALRFLEDRKASMAFNRRLDHIQLEEGRAASLLFASGETVTLYASDTVICAVPPWAIGALLPGIQAPDSYRGILNVHFRIAPPEGFPALTGVINATTEWIFAFPDRISITVSDADRLMQEERDVLAERIWQEISALTGLARQLPTWQIVKEKRATFAATPHQDARRPATQTPWRNLYLAGDYVQTGLPATIEGAIRSGASAAKSVMMKNT